MKYSGFVALQTWIDNYILNQYGSQAFIVTEVASQSIRAYNLDTFSSLAQYNIDFFTIFPLVVIFARMLYKILIEKEKKIRFLNLILGKA
jgi:hypothetical protein